MVRSLDAGTLEYVFVDRHAGDGQAVGAVFQLREVFLVRIDDHHVVTVIGKRFYQVRADLSASGDDYIHAFVSFT